MRCFIILALSALCLASTDYVTAPGGYQIPYECVYHVESGSLIVDQGDYLEVLDHHGSLLTTIKPCARQIYTHGSAWKAWSEYYDDTVDLSYFTSDWTVPPAPTSMGIREILYLWNGVEPSDNSAVLQPVLQYGNTPAGGGNYWALASWYVSSLHGTVVTDLFETSVGSVITGVMETDGTTWNVTGSDNNGNSITLQYAPKAWTTPNWLYEVLEAYYTQCTQYPASPCQFFNIATLPDVDIEWAAQTQDNTCDEHAEIINATAVTIHFSDTV